MTTRGDLLYGFRLSMEEVSRLGPAVADALRRLGAEVPATALPLEAFAAAGYAVHPAPGESRVVHVGWSLLPVTLGGEGGADAVTVDRARLQEAGERVQRVLDVLKLDKPLGYYLVVSGSGGARLERV